jgi:hypothetical protein
LPGCQLRHEDQRPALAFSESGDLSALQWQAVVTAGCRQSDGAEGPAQRGEGDPRQIRPQQFNPPSAVSGRIEELSKAFGCPWGRQRIHRAGKNEGQGVVAGSYGSEQDVEVRVPQPVAVQADHADDIGGKQLVHRGLEGIDTGPRNESTL